MCKLQHTFVVFIIYFNLDFTGILCRPLCYEHGRKSHIAIMELSPSCTYTPAECSQTKDPASTSIILEWKIKADTQRNCICSPLLFPMSLTHCLWKHEEGNHMQRVWPVNRSHLTSASHMLFPAKKLPWKAVARSSTEQRLSTGTLPCLTLDLHPWQLFLAAVLGFPLNCKVSLSGYFYAFFPSALCSDFMLLCCLPSSFFNLAIDYWYRSKINSFQANLHGEEQMIAVWIDQEKNFLPVAQAIFRQPGTFSAIKTQSKLQQDLIGKSDVLWFLMADFLPIIK